MLYSTLSFKAFPTCYADVSAFTPKEGAAEYHIMVYTQGTPDRAITEMGLFIGKCLKKAPYKNAVPLFVRLFLSDAQAQNDAVHRMADTLCRLAAKANASSASPSTPVPALSVIEQAPADGSPLAAWIYLKEDDGSLANYVWTTEKFATSGNVTQQTLKLLMDYSKTLEYRACTINNHCIRTWFYVRDIDRNYAAFAKTRKDYFTRIGLTDKTHYIASTGIQGNNAAPGSFVTMDALSIKNIRPDQITYLHGLSHLSPTHLYGVTFERGVAVQGSDRKTLYISGTASIDNKGNVMYLNDIEKQTLRMWENVEVLLKEAGATFAHLAQCIVYLRNPEDYDVVKALFETQFPSVPCLITRAPVCRPTWLIEMECIAVL